MNSRNRNRNNNSSRRTPREFNRRDLDRRIDELNRRLAEVDQRIAQSRSGAIPAGIQQNTIQARQQRLDSWRTSVVPQAVEFITQNLVAKHQRCLAEIGVEPDDWEGPWTQQDDERVEKAKITLIRAITRDFSYNRNAYN